jgi:hypothetical protein
VGFSHSCIRPQESAISNTAPSSSSDEYDPMCRLRSSDFDDSWGSSVLLGVRTHDCHVMELTVSEPRLRFRGFGIPQYCASDFRFTAFGVVGGDSCRSPFAADRRPAFLKRMPHALHNDCHTNQPIVRFMASFKQSVRTNYPKDI